MMGVCYWKAGSRTQQVTSYNRRILCDADWLVAVRQRGRRERFTSPPAQIPKHISEPLTLLKRGPDVDWLWNFEAKWHTIERRIQVDWNLQEREYISCQPLRKQSVCTDLSKSKCCYSLPMCLDPQP